MFPMYVVPLDVFMQMTKVRAHQLLLGEGKIVIFERSMGRVILVSHQWVGNTSPDPDFSQLQVLQEALHNVMSGKVCITDNLISQLRNSESTTLTAADFTAEPLFIWYDYFSCPQTLEGSDGELIKYDLSRAIDSIPGYVEMCVYFMILTPAVKHVDQGSMMNFRSWNKRGWCRAERAARFLSTVNTSMILIESPTRLEFSIPLETLWCPVGLGDFTVDADKKKVGHLMRLLLTNKLEALLAAGKFHDYRILLNLQSNLLKNLPIQPVTDTLPSLQKDSTNNNNMQPSSVPSISESVGTRRRTAGIDQRSASTPSVWASRKSGLDALMLSSLSLHNNNDNNNTNNNSDLVLREDEQSATVQQFLYQNGFTSIHERDEVGWTPTCFAALNGDHDLIRDLLASRANVNDCLSMTHPLLVLFNKGMFVLSLCAMFSNNAALKLLIAEKADVDASDCKGRVPLVSAGTGGNPEGIKILIASGSNPYHKNILGNGPMVHACVQGCHESVAAFLEAGVPVSGDHGTPLLHYAVAVPGADPILVKRLLEARADIDEPFEVRSLIFSMAFSIASCRYRLGSRDKFNSIGYHGISSTPLIFSVAAGSFALAQYLVDAGARLDCRNSRGKTAWDLAKELDAPSSLIMELEISNVEP